MNKTPREQELMDFIIECRVANAIMEHDMKAENDRLRMQLRLSREWLDMTEEHAEQLADKVFGRIATMKPDNNGITRFSIGGITEIVDERA